MLSYGWTVFAGSSRHSSLAVTHDRLFSMDNLTRPNGFWELRRGMGIPVGQGELRFDGLRQKENALNKRGTRSQTRAQARIHKSSLNGECIVSPLVDPD